MQSANPAMYSAYLGRGFLGHRTRAPGAEVVSEKSEGRPSREQVDGQSRLNSPQRAIPTGGLRPFRETFATITRRPVPADQRGSRTLGGRGAGSISRICPRSSIAQRRRDPLHNFTLETNGLANSAFRTEARTWMPRLAPT